MTQLVVVIAIGAMLSATVSGAAPATQPFADYVLDYDTPTDPPLQAKLEQIDASLRTKAQEHSGRSQSLRLVRKSPQRCGHG